MRLILSVIFILLIVSSAVALPTIQTGIEQPEGWECSMEKVAQKQFTANNTLIHVGIVCPTNAEIQLYACGRECLSSIPIERGYKIQGILPFFTKFEVDDKYYYDCFACRDSSTQPILSVPRLVRVLEGEVAHIPTSCTSVDSANTRIFFDGWMKSDTEKTNYFDAGRHQVTVTCYDDFGDSTSIGVVVEVVNNNRPPQIIVENR
jgi:hypothetical protein